MAQTNSDIQRLDQLQDEIIALKATIESKQKEAEDIRNRNIAANTVRFKKEVYTLFDWLQSKSGMTMPENVVDSTKYHPTYIKSEIPGVNRIRIKYDHWNHQHTVEVYYSTVDGLLFVPTKLDNFKIMFYNIARWQEQYTED